MRIRAGRDWRPLKGGLEVRAGSALDISSMGATHAPAGRYGWLRASRSDPARFEFEKRPGTAVRFNGANLCFGSLFPTHREADVLAERLKRLGFNSVRIHHYESSGRVNPSSGRVNPSGICRPGSPDSAELSRPALDRLDYLFAALKRHGLYLTTDLYVNRGVLRSEVFPGEAGRIGYGLKRLVHVSDRAVDNWKRFARRLLSHVNPYTGLAWGRDPALPLISIINEGTLANSLRDLARDPAEKALWETAFSRWKLDNGRKGDWGGAEFKRFLWETHLSTQRKLIKFLRKELKVRALLTDLNGWTDQWGAQACRTDFDYVDNHYYWDHPHFMERPWRLPSYGWSGGGSAIRAGGGLDNLAATRLLDRPFTVTEYNYTAPNPFRAEGGLLAGAMAALQDWAGLWRFSYSHQYRGEFTPTPLNFFDSATDPLRQASEYAIIPLFLRGDLPPAPPVVSISGSRKEYMAGAGNGMGGDIERLVWCARVGSLVGKQSGPGAVAVPLSRAFGRNALRSVTNGLRRRGLLHHLSRPEAGRFVAPGGGVDLDTASGVMTVSTPRTSGLAGPAGTGRKAGALEARIRDSWAALWATSLDGKALALSERMLVVHLTDLQSAGTRFRGANRRVLEAWGGMPWLVRRGTARISLDNAWARGLQVWRLDLSGRRVARMTTEAGPGRITFTADTATRPSSTLYYEVSLK